MSVLPERWSHSAWPSVAVSGFGLHCCARTSEEARNPGLYVKTNFLVAFSISLVPTHTVTNLFVLLNWV